MPRPWSERGRRPSGRRAAIRENGRRLAAHMRVAVSGMIQRRWEWLDTNGPHETVLKKSDQEAATSMATCFRHPVTP